MRDNDQRLINAIASGCDDAFASAYRSHKDRLLTAINCLLGGERAVAEDVLHDVFIQLVERAPSLRLQSSLRKYLMACCLNRARDYLRRRNIDRRSLGQSAPADLTHAAPSDKLESQEQSCLMMQLLSRLPEDQREAVTLHIHGEMTFSELADALEISINTAKSRYRYGLSKLQQWAAAHHIESGGK